MFPSAEGEAGPSTTRSLRSRSPVKQAAAPPIRSARSRLSIPSLLMDSTSEGPPAFGVSSPSPSSSHTATSGPPVDGAMGRPRRTYSRQSRPVSPPVVPSLLLPQQPFLHPTYTPTAPAPMTNSRSSSPLSSPSKTPIKSSPMPRTNTRKGREKAVPATLPRATAPRADRKPAVVGEKRVLPARIRRAAGTGADGIRDLEEMIVDWLERWGEPVESPPDSLVIHLTTLPLSLIDPPLPASPPEATASTPSEPPSAPPVPTQTTEDRQRIEVPTWKKVKPGEDDEEEAKDELQTMAFTQRSGRGGASPVKRLRHATADTPLEDTSDAYYTALHKKYEVFERRQRIREKETLQFERYKMRSRIDLLRGMSKTAWTAVVSVVLSRSAIGPAGPVVKRVLKMGEEEAVLATPPPRSAGEPDRWAKGRVTIEKEGADWLRDTLVKEGEEVMRRYDELLPPEHRKSRIIDMSPAPTTSYSPSLSPPPVVSHRVAALRDHLTSAPKRQPAVAAAPRRLTLTLKARPPPAPETDSVGAIGRKRKRPSEEGGGRRNRSRDTRPIPASDDKERRSSLRSSTPLQYDDVVHMGEPETDSEAGSPPAPTPAPAAVIKLHTPPISIRISRSSIKGAAMATSAKAAPAPSSRSLRSTRMAENTPLQGVAAMTGALSPDEARELHEVEAAVL